MELTTVSPQLAAAIAAILLANAGVMIGAYVSIRVQLARLQTSMDMSRAEHAKDIQRLEKDIDGLAANMRASQG